MASAAIPSEAPRRGIPWLSATPYLVLAVATLPIVVLYVWLLYSSFFERVEGFTPVGPFTFDNWRFLWDPQSVPQMRNRPAIVPLTINTFLFAAGSAAIVLLIASMAGYALSRIRFPGRRPFLGGILLLHSFPSVTLLIALFVVLRALGLYDRLIGVLLAKAAFELPFGIWIMKGFFDTVPIEIEEAAWVDGAHRLRTAFRIVLPLAGPGVAAAALIAFIDAWGDFLIPLILISDPNKMPISIGLFRAWTSYTQVDWGLLGALSIVYMIPAVVFYLFARRALARGLAGALAGT